MKAINGYFLIRPEDNAWKVANPMKISGADILEPTQSGLLGARFWRLKPGRANTLHERVKAEEFYFALEGVGRIRCQMRSPLLCCLSGVDGQNRA